MKRFHYFLLTVLVIAFLLSGCSGKDTLVGVYMPKNASGGNETIILYQDGTCHYFGDAHATWTVDSDTVIITTYRPAEYYLNISLDEEMADAEKRAIGTRINRVEAVLDSEYLSGENPLWRVRIVNEESVKQAQEAISAITSVKRVELEVVEARAQEHKLKVVDNCLVTGGGYVYIKQGE